MSWFGDEHDHSRAYNEYHSNPKHEAHVSHELIAGAAAYEAAKAYQEHLAKNGGEPPSHAKAKQIIAGLAGAFIDREFETHGLDFIDKEKAKHAAKKHAEEAVTQYGGYGGYGPSY
ncbi:CipC1 protein [Russula earlei]|uniref:CipC1 protein n=1 Tax=Russula earlei TaxID=71964 RepID=A0ACC0UAX9_9AGAM|nr:CipC1 protein [Russula earlei]